MTTPTPGDLSARLLLVAQAIKPIKGLQGMDATVLEAIAALSALPAAGGLRCTDPDNCRRCSEDANTPHAGIPRDSSARTTPPPEITK